MGRDERNNPQHQQNQINRAIGQSRGVYDRFGRQIIEGAMVVFHAAQDPAFLVKSIAPVLDPGAPPDAVRLTLVVEMPVVVKAGVAVNEFIVGHYPEKVIAQVGDNGGEHSVNRLALVPDAAPEPEPAPGKKEDEKPQ